ncbi:MAG: TetR family transcriptional regulator [Burkholderiaceae bacterium]|nr:TetR family transcriptional regulator [Microbacteriaceae bacterium]
MRSLTADDATTVSRIRDAAVLLFGRSGYDATSVRAIAAEAKVSAGLVIHHFGTKEALRLACDEHIVAEVMSPGGADASGTTGAPETTLADGVQRWIDNLDVHRPALDYLARMLTDRPSLADGLFDALVDRTEAMIAEGAAAGVMHRGSDPRMTAVIVAAQGLMPLLLERHIGRAIGEAGLSVAAIRRMTLPSVELYTHGLYATTALLDATRAGLASGEGTHS